MTLPVFVKLHSLSQVAMVSQPTFLVSMKLQTWILRPLHAQAPNWQAPAETGEGAAAGAATAGACDEGAGAAASAGALEDLAAAVVVGAAAEVVEAASGEAAAAASLAPTGAAVGEGTGSLEGGGTAAFSSTAAVTPAEGAEAEPDHQALAPRTE